MAGTVTTAIDKVTPKSPTALRVVFGKTAGNETSLAIGGIQDWDYVTKEMLVNYIAPPPVVFDTIAAGDPDVYTLSAGNLAIVNLMGCYPNFVAITTASGQQWFDIFPFYTGSPGSFTAITVQLHSDGTNNIDNTFIQFS